MDFLFTIPDVYTNQILASGIQKMFDLNPLPKLFVRTLKNTAKTRGAKLLKYVISVLAGLITKKVWEDASLWRGFILCCGVSNALLVPISASRVPAFGWLGGVCLCSPLPKCRWHLDVIRGAIEDFFNVLSLACRA